MMSGKRKNNDKTEKMNTKPRKEPNSNVFYEVAMLVTILVCILLFLSNFGLIGPVGGFISGVLFGLFGLLAFVVPVIMLPIVVYALHLGRLSSRGGKKTIATKKENRKRLIKLALIIVALLSISVLTELFINSNVADTSILDFYRNSSENRNGSGLIGGLFVSLSVTLIGRLGTYITTIVILLICIIALTGKPLVSLIGARSAKVSAKAYEDVKKHHAHVVQKREERREKKRNQMLLPSESIILEESDEESRENASEDLFDNTGTAGKKSRKSSTLLDLDPDEFDESTNKKTGGFLNSLLSAPPEKVEHKIPKGRLYEIYSGKEKDKDDQRMDGNREDVSGDFTDSLKGKVDSIDKDQLGSIENTQTDKQMMEEEVLSGKSIGQHMNNRKKGGDSPSEYIYKKPPINLLAKSKSNSYSQDTELVETAQKLERILDNFGVKVSVTNASSGPSVTRYELQPEQGVKVARIVGLADDIKLNLAVSDIRIEAPIPGKAAVGIEVPNKENTPVMLRDLLESPEFVDNPSKITFAVGRDIGGRIMVADIALMPHLLIAGATGSGKSVCINTLIASILYKADPSEVKLIMIDPKMVELSVYNGIPHLLLDVVTDPKKAAGALNWALAEMTRRYQLLAEFNVRDIQAYNEKAMKLNLEKEMDFLDEDKRNNVTFATLPQIVIIVDELADLMMVAPSEVESAICRLAQLARAAGIHLIVATQRPSVNVITGLIKANMPSRIAFSVTSGVDSRTIIDMNGAEKLLGRGDMLFYPTGYAKPVRVQGSFISDEEVHKIVDFLKNEKEKEMKANSRIKKTNKESESNDSSVVEGSQESFVDRIVQATFEGEIIQNVYNEQRTNESIEETPVVASSESEIEQYLNGSIVSSYPGAPGGAQEDERDNYFAEAGFLIIEKEKASIGMLQRMFRIGFNRAARIMDQLHESGVVSGEEGTKPRNILMNKEEFQAYLEESGSGK